MYRVYLVFKYIPCVWILKINVSRYFFFFFFFKYLARAWFISPLFFFFCFCGTLLRLIIYTPSLPRRPYDDPKLIRRLSFSDVFLFCIFFIFPHSLCRIHNGPEQVPPRDRFVSGRQQSTASFIESKYKMEYAHVHCVLLLYCIKYLRVAY